ncbi:ankyrin repeat protein, putative [Trichomonas vaginalis G3]|uniref:Ankyrin repeat protein, putative n=1 Tax=Trichomonas vaginalis (strain ATCC PRA-98 / G3) TaxID=412133 RepID=A2F668_TRIV3|nr:potassium channel [Trichomonas vaginalis G3]EAX99585.1 ankyrin repeat protein, putative [Trichomonas vaginalis G3]KAI5506464.1 potassium channel [Trichomonas vaginalis G3]|eukprot:XP_001312515.1 ankyrin repeat protein [Trichomonas vaginalis G3]
MKKLLEKGADVNQINKVNKNALHFAVENDAYEACVLLLDIGADQDQRDDEGCFPAHYTLDNENERLMKLCIDKGFQPDFCDFTMDVDFVHKIYDKHVRKQYGGRRGMWVYVGDRNSRNDFYF